MTESVTHAVPALLAAASEQGPGNTLRILLLVSMIGGALLAWFLLRGYRQTETDTDADTAAGTPTDPAAAAAPAPPESPAAASATPAETPAATPAARTGNGSTDANA
ncbi:hypothetical protein ABZ990_14265 [Streptomyces sp. NPDC046203]|uniref:hypothetical protein n=1 Tax=Streptomyces sp. NPDC046203 TaxID=3154602 RepID=UPI0033E0E01A